MGVRLSCKMVDYCFMAFLVPTFCLQESAHRHIISNIPPLTHRQLTGRMPTAAADVSRRAGLQGGCPPSVYREDAHRRLTGRTPTVGLHRGRPPSAHGEDAHRTGRMLTVGLRRGPHYQSCLALLLNTHS